jgi:TfoX/Sxy family transcriptional regulator of competence genes
MRWPASCHGAAGLKAEKPERRTMTSEEIVDFLRRALAGRGAIRETRMFGGVGFMLNGNMVAGTFRQGLLVRVGKDRQPAALNLPGARQMDMNGRLMEGYVHIDFAALSERTAAAALDLAVAFVRSLPPKPGDAGSRQKRGKRT